MSHKVFTFLKITPLYLQTFRNAKTSSTSVKVQAYTCLVRSSLEYACSYWDSYNKGEIDQLERAQRRTARFLSNRQRYTSCVGDMLQLLNIKIHDLS